MWSDKVHRTQNPRRVDWASRAFLCPRGRSGLHPRPLCPGPEHGPLGSRNHWAKCLAHTCQVSPLHLALLLGSNPLEYSRICPPCLPAANKNLVMSQQRRGAGEGLRLSAGPCSVWVPTQGRCRTETFKTFKAAGSCNGSFPNQGAWHGQLCHAPAHLWPPPARGRSCVSWHVGSWVRNTQDVGGPGDA